MPNKPRRNNSSKTPYRSNNSSKTPYRSNNSSKTPYKSSSPSNSKPTPPLIFIHGFRGSPAGLQEIADHLSDQYKIYLPAIPPFAGAGDLPAYTPDTYADFIANFIKSHHLKRPVLIGHSMGSLIAAATAAKYPNLINTKLILLAPISTKPPKPIAALQPLSTLLPNKIVSRLTTRYLFIPKHSPELYRKALALTISAGAEYSSKAAVRESCHFSATHSLADFDFNQDTLLLAGAHDRLISKKQTQKYATHHIEKQKPLIHGPRTQESAPNPQTKTHFIKNTGHLLNYENPAATAEAIRHFLS